MERDYRNFKEEYEFPVEEAKDTGFGWAYFWFGAFLIVIAVEAHQEVLFYLDSLMK